MPCNLENTNKENKEKPKMNPSVFESTLAYISQLVVAIVFLLSFFLN